MFSIVYGDNVAVASVFDDIPEHWSVIDCRPLIDGPGNADALVHSILRSGLDKLRQTHKVCFACDYGHSRSNLLAALAIAQFADIPTTEALQRVSAAHPESSIKPGLLNSILPKDLPSKPTSRRFAITGANGLIGSRLSRLMEQSHHVPLTLTRESHGNYLSDAHAIEGLIEGSKITDIVHLAHPKPYNSYKTSREALFHTSCLAQACASQQCMLHFISGWTVFDGSEQQVVQEDTSPNPHSLYGQSKALQEIYLNWQNTHNDLRSRIYRLPGLYANESREPRFLRYIADCVASRTAIVVHRFLNGSAVVPLSHVDGAVQELFDRICSDDAQRCTIHLTRTTINLSVMEIAEIVAAKYGVSVVSTPVNRIVFTGTFSSLAASQDRRADFQEFTPMAFIEQLVEQREAV